MQSSLNATYDGFWKNRDKEASYDEREAVIP